MQGNILNAMWIGLLVSLALPPRNTNNGMRMFVLFYRYSLRSDSTGFVLAALSKTPEIVTTMISNNNKIGNA